MKEIDVSYDNLYKKEEPRSGPLNLDPYHLTLLKVFLKKFNFEKKKSAEENKNMKNYPACRVKKDLV